MLDAKIVISVEHGRISDVRVSPHGETEQVQNVKLYQPPGPFEPSEKERAIASESFEMIRRRFEEIDNQGRKRR